MPPKRSSKRQRPNKTDEERSPPNSKTRSRQQPKKTIEDIPPPRGRKQLLQNAKKASKSRRDQESEEFAQLLSLLPVAEDVKSRLDKGAILRLTIAYLQNRNMAAKNIGPLSILASPGVDEAVEVHRMLEEGLDGFMIVVNHTGHILYVSDSVTNILGFQAHEINGGDLIDFTTDTDYAVFKSQFRKVVPRDKRSSYSQSQESEQKEAEKSTNEWIIGDTDISRHFRIRLKYKVVNSAYKTKQTGFIALQWQGKLRMLDMGGTPENPKPTLCLMAICSPFASLTQRGPYLYENTFVVRYGLADKACTYCDERITHLMGYEPSEIVGSDLMKFYHPEDLQIKMHACMQVAYGTGYAMSLVFRMINKLGRYVWMEVQLIVVYGPKHEPLFAIGINHVLSEKDGEDLAKHRKPGTLAIGSRPSAKEPFLLGNEETSLADAAVKSRYCNLEQLQLLMKSNASISSDSGIEDSQESHISDTSSCSEKEPSDGSTLSERRKFPLISQPGTNPATSAGVTSSEDASMQNVYQRVAICQSVTSQSSAECPENNSLLNITTSANFSLSPLGSSGSGSSESTYNTHEGAKYTISSPQIHCDAVISDPGAQSPEQTSPQNINNDDILSGLPQDLVNVNFSSCLFDRDEDVTMDHLLDDLLDIELIDEQKEEDSMSVEIPQDSDQYTSSGSVSGSSASYSEDMVGRGEPLDVNLISNMDTMDNLIDDFLRDSHMMVTETDLTGLSENSSHVVDKNSYHRSSGLSVVFGENQSRQLNDLQVESPALLSNSALNLFEFEDLF